MQLKTCQREYVENNESQLHPHELHNLEFVRLLIKLNHHESEIYPFLFVQNRDGLRRGKDISLLAVHDVTSASPV